MITASFLFALTDKNSSSSCFLFNCRFSSIRRLQNVDVGVKKCTHKKKKALRKMGLKDKYIFKWVLIWKGIKCTSKHYFLITNLCDAMAFTVSQASSMALLRRSNPSCSISLSRRNIYIYIYIYKGLGTNKLIRNTYM